MRDRLVRSVPLATVAVLALAGPAEAHTELQASVPGANAPTSTSPGIVRLSFNEAVLDIGAQVSEVSPSGRQTRATSVDVAGSTVTARFPERTAPGRYRVDWRVVADDGHPVTGEFAFTYVAPTNPSAAAAAALPAAPTADPATIDATRTKDASGAGVPWGLIGVAAVAVLGVVAYRRVRAGAR